MDKFDLLTKDEVVTLYKGTEDLLLQFKERIRKLEDELLRKEQIRFALAEQVINIKHQIFGKSSEKSPRDMRGERKNTGEKKKRVLLPSERYPNLMVIEKDVMLEAAPSCPCCQEAMSDSGMTEDSEYLTVIPKSYYVVRQKRHKYRCGKCHGALVTAPMIPRIKPGSGFSDEMIIDVAMSKYLELMPIERQASAAKRDGVDLAPNSMIESTHDLAEFVVPVYENLKKDIIESEVAHADETPHKMLEGDKKSNWSFWGFSNGRSSYFEAHDTRSGDVAVKILKDSKCRFLVSDVFSGYQKAVTETNKIREGPPIVSLYCNAHARRKFVEALRSFPEAEFFVSAYRAIYRARKSALHGKLGRQRLYMEAMRKKALKIETLFSSKSSMGMAISYFLKNFEGLSRFTQREDLPIDNNAQERLLRSPVIGRKTWYGTHSPRGARTASILFSIVESCKLNGLNPRQYLRDLVYSAHQGQGMFTPAQYAAKSSRKDGES